MNLAYTAQQARDHGRSFLRSPRPERMGVDMSERVTRVAVIVVDLFAAASATAGAVGLVVGFMNIPLSVLRSTPFTDFTVPALLLGIVVGGSALAAAVIALFGPGKPAVFGLWRSDTLASATAGCIMVG